MTVAKLIEILQEMPQDALIVTAAGTHTSDTPPYRDGIRVAQAGNPEKPQYVMVGDYDASNFWEWPTPPGKAGRPVHYPWVVGPVHCESGVKEVRKPFDLEPEDPFRGLLVAYLWHRVVAMRAGEQSQADSAETPEPEADPIAESWRDRPTLL